jgi:hypothetical protein
MANRENRDAIAALVPTPAKAVKTVRANVTFPQDELERIDHFAEEHGMTRAGFLLRAARHEMEHEAA